MLRRFGGELRTYINEMKLARPKRAVTADEHRGSPLGIDDDDKGDSNMGEVQKCWSGCGHVWHWRVGTLVQVEPASI